MNEIEKFFRKIPKGDRAALRLIITKLHLYIFDGMDIKKLAGYKDLYRVRVGRYRVIYQDFGGQVEIRTIRKRDDSTYENL